MKANTKCRWLCVLSKSVFMFCSGQVCPASQMVENNELHQVNNLFVNHRFKGVFSYFFWYILARAFLSLICFPLKKLHTVSDEEQPMVYMPGMIA